MLRLKRYYAESWDAGNILGGVHSSGIRFQSVLLLVLSVCARERYRQARWGWVSRQYTNMHTQHCYTAMPCAGIFLLVPLAFHLTCWRLQRNTLLCLLILNPWMIQIFVTSACLVPFRSRDVPLCCTEVLASACCSPFLMVNGERMSVGVCVCVSKLYKSPHRHPFGNLFYEIFISMFSNVHVLRNNKQHRENI